MKKSYKEGLIRKAQVVATIAAAGSVLAGCAANPEPYDGAYDPNFYDSLHDYVGEEVSLSAEVLDVLSPASFTVISGDDLMADPLLVVNAEDSENVRPGMPVRVTGAVQETFDLKAVEEGLGVDLDDALHEEWIGDYYLDVTAIDAPAA